MKLHDGMLKEICAKYQLTPIEAKIIRFPLQQSGKGHCHRYCGAEDASEGECVGCGGIVGEQVTACRHMKKIPIFFSTGKENVRLELQISDDLKECADTISCTDLKMQELRQRL